jgi:hypothetical protein
MIYKGLILVSMLFLMACSSTPPVAYNNNASSSEPVVRVFYANYEYTWETALKEMQRFNLKIVNKDSGTILTDDLTGYSSGFVRSQFRYSFDVRIEALPPDKGLPQTQVSITKFVYKEGGLFPEKSVRSNFIDEKVILYRIKRLLEIERKKLERTGNQSTTVH